MSRLRTRRSIGILVCVAMAASLVVAVPGGGAAGLSSSPDVFTIRCQLAQKWTPVDPILEQAAKREEEEGKTPHTHVHSHDFFGAPGIGSSTTSSELISDVTSEGNSSCFATNFRPVSEAGDEFDGSGYWVPTLHLKKKEVKEGKEVLVDVPVEPSYMFTYYQRVWKTQTSGGTPLNHVVELPDSTRMIAGSSSGTVPTYVSSWICLNDASPTLYTSGLPKCEGTSGALIAARINFPFCLSNRVYSGEVTDWTLKFGSRSAYIKGAENPSGPQNTVTNVAYPKVLSSQNTCPEGFDQEIPRLFLTVVYPYSGKEANIDWARTYAEGGAYLGGGGGGSEGEEEQRMPVTNMHADFMNGWVKSDNPAEPSPLHGSTCVKGDETAVAGCGLNTLIAECVNTKNAKGEYAQGEKGTGCSVIKSTRP